MRAGPATQDETTEREQLSACFTCIDLGLSGMALDVMASFGDGKHPRFMNAPAFRTCGFRQTRQNSAQLGGRGSCQSQAKPCCPFRSTVRTCGDYAHRERAKGHFRIDA